MSIMTVKEFRETSRMIREVSRMTPAQRELIAKLMLAERATQRRKAVE